MNEQNLLPQKTLIQERYSSYRPVFSECLEKIESRLKKVLHLASAPTYKTRIKSFDSYYKKILRQKAYDSATSTELVTLTDMMGIRVICAFLADIENVVKQLSQNFDVREVERKGSQQSFREFGYESVHVLISIPSDCYPVDHVTPVLPKDVVCEIQVRTILQDACAEVEHELIYKSEFNPFDKPLRRKLAAINANLGLADTIFQEIRDYQNKLQAELGLRRDTFYDKADKFTDETLGLSSNSNDMGKFSSGTVDMEQSSIDDLVLAALHEHNCGNFEKALKIYTKIIDTEPRLPDVMLSVILKHRGMAYFAQNNYQNALDDFHESSVLDANAFRSMYYEGIVYSVLQNDKKAIECFDKSLEANHFQSHVYYRKAVSEYNLGMYNEAMSNLNKAFDLGLDDEDSKNFRTKLLKKFDMGM